MPYTLLIDTYIGYPITADYVREKLDATEGKPATVLVNSLGGDLNTALNIRQQFLDHGAVTVHYTGLSASAATILATGAAHITMSPHALILIHQCLGYSEAWGYYNRDQLQSAIDQLKKQQSDLDTIDRVVASIYADRAHTDPKHMAALMAEERWLTAQEALELGLIDEIREAPDDQPQPLTATARAHIAACGYPLPLGDDASSVVHAATPQPHWLATLIHTLRDLLRPTASTPDNQPTNTTTNMQDTPHPIQAPALAAALGIDTIQATEQGQVTLTEAQIQAIEAHIHSLQEAKAKAEAQRDQAIKAQEEATAKAEAAQAAQAKAEATLAASDGDDTTPAAPTAQEEAPINAAIAAANFFHKLGSAM